MFFTFLPEWLNMLLSLITIVMVPVVTVVLFVAMGRKTFSAIWYVISLQPIRRRRLRQQLQQQLEYYRDLPADGNLKIANAVMNSLSSSPIADYQGLFGALILRLISKEALNMEVKATVYGSEPHPVLSIGKQPKEELPMVEQKFLSMLIRAAGNDGVLQPRELQQYLRKNKSEDFFQYLKTLDSDERAVAESPDTARQLLGLRKFLLDFSLIGIRDIKELPLWREYLVYATLFGIADQVSRNFSELHSDYFSANSIALTQLNVIGNHALVTYTNAINQAVG